MIDTIRWINGSIRIIDQTKLPEKEIYLSIYNIDELIDAVKKLKIRGAPALGITGAYGTVLALAEATKTNVGGLIEKVHTIAKKIIMSRPTAINLNWGVSRILKIIEQNVCLHPEEIMKEALTEATKILEDDIRCCQLMGIKGSDLIDEGCSILTHCNTGGLATGGFGTALGVAVTAHQQKKKIHVYVDETRPVLQGSRLTAWELQKEGIDHTVITDNMAGYLMAQKKIHCVIVGADRIAANGDTANKIGTYALAVLSEKHRIPFYVAAPMSTVDRKTKCGYDIPIEERKPEEITHFQGHRIVPLGSKVYNPAFDVTPASMITAIITENDIYKGPHYNFADFALN